MAITIASNIAALQAHRRLDEATSSLASISERLSSGMRINHASDDAASLAIIEGMRTDNRVYTRAVKNVSDGISMLQVAEGALNALGSIVQRQIELAEQSANGVYTLEQRRALDNEADALTREHNRIVESTRFNGISVLGASTKTTFIQSGYGESESTRIALGYESITKSGLGSFTSVFTYAAAPSTITSWATGDLNQDGNRDLISTEAGSSVSLALLGNGNGTFLAATTIENGGVDANNPAGSTLIDANMDGILDFIFLNSDFSVVAADNYSVFIGNGDGTFKAGTSFATPYTDLTGLAAADFNGDGRDDLAMNANNGSTAIYLSNGDGTFRFTTTTGNSYSLAAGDINNDGNIDLVSAASGSRTSWLGNGDGTFRFGTTFAGTTQNYSVSLADFNSDGRLDMVTSRSATGGENVTLNLGLGDGTFQSGVTFTVNGAPTSNFSHSIGDFNNDGFIDIAARNGALMFGNGDGTFRQNTTSIPSSSNTHVQAYADFNNDGVLDHIGKAGSSGVVILADTISQLTIQDYTADSLNLLTQQASRTSLRTAQAMSEMLSLGMAQIGAAQSRLESMHKVLSSRTAGLASAEASIRDVDYAQESAALTKSAILQQTAAAVLVHAAAQPEIVLRLLRVT